MTLDRRDLAASLAVFALALGAAPAAFAEDNWWTPRLRDKELATAEPEAQLLASSAGAPAGQQAEEMAAPTLPDASLAKLTAALREGPIGTDPNAVAYLDLIDTGRASAAQVNDFAAYLAKRGMPRVALAFQQHALRLDRANPTLWLNLGTLHRNLLSYGPATTAFKKAIALDPNNALAHYNLGAVYDAQKNYDAAIEEYRRALVLDPDLADPRKNPQVVNNENLLAVKLEIYQNQAGSLGLPLLQMQKPAEAPKPKTETP